MNLKRWWERAQRRWLLRLLARATPGELESRGLKRLPAVVKRAKKLSPAYQALYADVDVSAANPGLQSLPILTKSDLFERHPLDELVASDQATDQLASILTSSGHGGVNFAFGLSTWRDKQLTPFDIDLGLEHAFGTDSKSTLLVNCLPMGVVFESRTVCVANVSVREDMACAILAQAGRHFDQCILVVDPLFAKRLLDYAAQINLQWSTLNMRVIIGEEPFSEEFRTYLCNELHILIDSPGGQLARSSMGVGELGLNLFFETAETICLRRSIHRETPDEVVPTFFAFSPLRSLVEICDPDESGVGDLVITMLDRNAPIPMIRYRTGDRARRLTREDKQWLSKEQREAVDALPFPVIALVGKVTASENCRLHLDRAKALQYRDSVIARELSGAFVIRDDAGVTHWDLQRSCFSSADCEQLSEGLHALLVQSDPSLACDSMQVKVWPYAEFRWGMGLDHERKFRYLPLEP